MQKAMAEVRRVAEAIGWSPETLVRAWQAAGIAIAADPPEVRVKRYNHAYDVAFSVVSNDPEGLDVTPVMFRAALMRRIKQLDAEAAVGGWEEACGAPYDTYEEEGNVG